MLILKIRTFPFYAIKLGNCDLLTSEAISAGVQQPAISGPWFGVSNSPVRNRLLDGNTKTTIHSAGIGYPRSFTAFPFDPYSIAVLHNSHGCPLPPPTIYLARSRDPDSTRLSQF